MRLPRGLDALHGPHVRRAVVDEHQQQWSLVSLSHQNAVNCFFQVVGVRVEDGHHDDDFRQVGVELSLFLLLCERSSHWLHTDSLVGVACDKVTHMHRVKDLFAVVGQVDALATLEKGVHVAEAGLFFGSGIRLAFSLFFCLLNLDLVQAIDGGVVDILDFVHGDDCHDRPVEANRVRLVPGEHVKLDCFVTFEFKSIRLGDLRFGNYLGDDLADGGQAIDGAAEVEGVIPIKL